MGRDDAKPDAGRKGAPLSKAPPKAPPKAVSKAVVKAAAKAAAKPKSKPAAARRARGFLRAGALAPQALKGVGAKRGFAELRLLTEWTAVAGEALAKLCNPVKVTYGGRGGPGLGATLVVTAEGARAPEVEMARVRIIERVNAFYGYRAVSRLRIDQTLMGRAAPASGFVAGFAEGGAGFDGPPPQSPPHPPPQPPAPTPGVADDRLALALARLGANVRANAKKKQTAATKPASSDVKTPRSHA